MSAITNSADGTRRTTRTAPSRAMNPVPVIVAVLCLGLGAALISQKVSDRQAALYLLGASMGVVLYHAAFGFTSAWRVFISDRRGAGLRAQMLMLAVATALFYPTLAAGSIFGQPVVGAVAPLGTSVVVGAFLFGVGMQLGGGCASGTLYTVGGGSTRLVITLVGFIAGSVLGAAHLHLWSELPSLPAISLVRVWGPWVALALNAVALALIVGLTIVLERRRHGRLISMADVPSRGIARMLRGPWPLLVGAVALAVLNFTTLILAGRPWGITSAFALWGSKIAAFVGLDPATWPYWSSPQAAAALKGSILSDITSVMDIGIIVGALLAAGLAGRFAPVWRVPARQVAAAIVGGLMLGYGARLAYGCNIGAFFSGVASGSVHGWLWLAAAFAGNVAGTRLRPLFGLAVEYSRRPPARGALHRT